jgi:hypothetical protein
MPGENFDPKITLKKFFTGLVMVIVPEALLYTVNFMETETFPVEYAAAVAVSVAVLHALINLVKHWND